MSFIMLVTESGEQHGCVNTVANSVKNDNFQRFAEKDREAMRKLRKEESKTVKARYLNHRGMHERLDKPYMRWDGDPITYWHLIPGHVYDLPMGFINEINGNPGLANRSEKLDSRGNPTAKDGSPERIHELIPISF